MIRLWVGGLLRHQAGRIAGAAAGIAVAVALLASLGAFLTHSRATMTDRAVRGVGVDWQIQLQPGGDVAAVDGLVRSTEGATTQVTVQFGTTSGLSATTGGSTQTTGAGVVVGLPVGYRSLFPTELRTLAGADSGVLVAQQTAANLQVVPGDSIEIGRAGLPPASVVVAGVVDLPHADRLFQRVGVPATGQPVAPPDNVLLVPDDTWQSVFGPLTAGRPDLVSTQIHVQLDHQLPPDPAAAFAQVTASAHHVEAVGAGSVVVGDNLAAALDAARSDAAYAQLLFGFLGLPGAVLAALLTSTIVSAGAGRRRTEQALLRARGASTAQLLRLAGAEAVVVGVTGGVVGLAAAALVGRIAFGTVSFGSTAAGTVGWAAGCAAVGLAIALATVLVPARRDLRRDTVVAGRAAVEPARAPTWARYGVDLALLVAAGWLWVATGTNGYQLVLAPEGVATIAISYWALAAPALMWCGLGMFGWRLADLLLGRGRPMLRRALHPIAGSLAAPVSASLSRQRRPLVRAITMLGLAIAFAVSTATFNATYLQQAEADAQLTNGADVTVTRAPGGTGGPVGATEIAAVSGVVDVEPVQHRFAYIGADLQDLYGVQPATISRATALQDSYFQGGTAIQLMDTLAAQPDSILVAAETVQDYQLQVGDQLNLRLPDARTGQLTTVPFRYIGVVSEFPTAPKDSFFVANTDYLGQQTGDPTPSTFLVNTGGRQTSAVADRLRALVGLAATVTDISSTRETVGSTLTAVDLTALSRVELGFALVLATCAGGLAFGLGLAERRRTFAIATALGARAAQLRRMIGSESAVLAAAGLCMGLVAGWALSVMLVKMLTGVFDPPPAAIPVPWGYVTTMTLVVLLGLTAVTAVASRTASRAPMGVIRAL